MEEERSQRPAQATPPPPDGPIPPSEFARARRVVPLRGEMTPEQAKLEARILREEILVPARRREAESERRCAELTLVLFERWERLLVVIKTDAAGREKGLLELEYQPTNSIDERALPRNGSWGMYNFLQHVTDQVTSGAGYREPVRQEVRELLTWLEEKGINAAADDYQEDHDYTRWAELMVEHAERREARAALFKRVGAMGLSWSMCAGLFLQSGIVQEFFGEGPPIGSGGNNPVVSTPGVSVGLLLGAGLFLVLGVVSTVWLVRYLRSRRAPPLSAQAGR